MRFGFSNNACSHTLTLYAGQDNSDTPEEIYVSVGQTQTVTVTFAATAEVTSRPEPTLYDIDYDPDMIPPAYSPGLEGGYAFQWTGVDSHSDTSLSSSAPKAFTETGDYDVTCVASDAFTPADDSVTMKWKIHVMPAETPDCSDDAQRDGCDEGGGCSSCAGGGSDAPTPSLETETVTASASLPGPGGGSGNGGGTGACEKNKVTVYERANGCSPVFKYKVKDSCGVCHGLFSLDPPTSVETEPSSGAWPLGDGAIFHVDLYYDGHSECKCTYPDGSVRRCSLGKPQPADYEASSGFSNTDGPNEDPDTPQNEDIDSVDTAWDQGPDGQGNYYDSVTTGAGDEWRYYHAQGDSKITKVQQQVQDAPYTSISYVSSGSAAGKVQSVVVYDHDNQEKSRVDYAYYTTGANDGKLFTVTKGTKQTKYEYDSATHKITVTEQQATSPYTAYGVTEYLYIDTENETEHIHETHVTRKHASDSNKDQTTVYSYYYDLSAGVRTVLKSVTDPLGGRIEYEYWDAPTTRTCNGRVKYEKRFNADSDPLGSTYYEYNSTTGAVKLIQRIPPDGSSDPTITETTGYYQKDSVDTPHVKWTRDTRGKCTYYDRNNDYLWQIDAVRVSTPLQTTGDPDEWTWPQRTVVKRYLYYGRTYSPYGTGSTANGKKGQLWIEMTMDDDGQTPLQMVEYKYSQNGVYHDSPTQTKYVTWSGTAFVDYTGMHATTTTSFDGFGRVDATTDANSRTVTYTYDDLGRQKKTIYATSPSEVASESFYSCCNLEMTKDEEDNYTYYKYDDMNRLQETWTDLQVTANPNNHSVSDAHYPLVHYTYDAFGNVDTVTTYSDASHARVTTYTYDKLNRVTKIEYPDGIVADEECGYDDYGNLLWKKDGKNEEGCVTLYEHDTLGRLKGVYYNYDGDFPADYGELTADVTYGYDEYDPESHYHADPGGSLKTLMTDSTGTSRYAYDIKGQLTRYVPSIKNPGTNAYPYVVDYGYNNLGQKTSILIGGVDPVCAGEEWGDHPYDFVACGLVNPVYQVNYNYYNNGWLHQVINAGDSTTVANYTYLANGVRDTIIYGNGTSTEFDYDNDSRYRVSGITHKNGATVLADVSYRDDNEVPPNPGRDKVGNPLRMEDWTGTWSYGYDGMNRLTNATAPSPTPNQPAGGTYGYDWVGNRVHPPSGSSPMVYNKADQLTSWPGMRQYTYYDDGSVEHVKNAGGTSTLSSYTYTPTGLLATATYNGRTLTNTWDASNQRVGMNANGTDYSFVYDVTAGIPAVIEEVKEGTLEVAAYYFRDPGGALICRAEDANTSYYHFDALGSTRLLTDSDGDITDKYAYDAYGALIAHDRLAGSVDQPYQYVGQLGYYTHWMEPEFSLMQLGVRFYDTEVGRFTQSDPARQGPSGYTYAAGCPLSYMDPWGLFTYKDAVTFYMWWWSGVGDDVWISLSDVSWGSVDPVLSSPQVRAAIGRGGCTTTDIDDTYGVAFDSGTPEAVILGQVALSLKGKVYSNRGRWMFKGRIKLHDTYDFNSALRFDSVRGIIGSIAVGIGGGLGWGNPGASGKDYDIDSRWTAICRESPRIRPR